MHRAAVADAGYGGGFAHVGGEDDAPPARPAKGSASGAEDQLAPVVGVADAVFYRSAAEYVADAHADDLGAGVVASADEGVLHAPLFAASVHDHVAGGAVGAQVGFIGYADGGAVVGAWCGGQPRHLGAVAALIVGAVGAAAPPVRGVGAELTDAAAGAPVGAELAAQFVLLGVNTGVNDSDADARALAGVPGGGDVHEAVVPGYLGTGADGGEIRSVEAAARCFGAAGAGAQFKLAAFIVAGLEVAHLGALAELSEYFGVEHFYFQDGEYAVFGGNEEFFFGDVFAGEAGGGFEQVVDQLIARGLPFASVDVDFVDGLRQVFVAGGLVAEGGFVLAQFQGGPDYVVGGFVPVEYVVGGEEVGFHHVVEFRSGQWVLAFGGSRFVEQGFVVTGEEGEREGAAEENSFHGGCGCPDSVFGLGSRCRGKLMESKVGKHLFLLVKSEFI